MNKKIQPEFKDATITCACGNTFKTKSVQDTLRVDICSKCHPFWSKAQKQTVKGGRADKFKQKYGL